VLTAWTKYKETDMATRFDQKDHLVEMFGNSDKVLREVVDAMSDSEFNEIYQFIARMWDIEEA